MIRKAAFNDIELIEDTYNEHFKYENEHGAFTVFKKGIYPTRKDAEKAGCALICLIRPDAGLSGLNMINVFMIAQLQTS